MSLLSSSQQLLAPALSTGYWLCKSGWIMMNCRSCIRLAPISPHLSSSSLSKRKHIQILHHFPLKKKCQKKKQHQPTHHTHPSFGSSDLFIKVCFFRSDAADGQNATLRAIRPTDLGVVVLRSPVPDAHATLVVYQHFLTHLGRLVGWRMPNSTSDASDVANLNKNRVWCGNLEWKHHAGKYVLISFAKISNQLNGL